VTFRLRGFRPERLPSVSQLHGGTVTR
jgi:hypothetical protein